ncbi:hypothetical protein B0H11DRAFT_2355509 [Mycena galericulata]|nr:hypothetical protein B0H11DRAFT_2355509 [Mycena galericulata]
MVQISRIFAFLSIASVGLAVVVQRQATPIVNDFNSILSGVQALTSVTVEFNSSATLAQAAKVATAAVNLNTVIKTTTNDVIAFPGNFTDSVTKQILDEFAALQFQQLKVALFAAVSSFAALGFKSECCNLVTINEQLVVALEAATKIKAGDLALNVTSQFSAAIVVLGQIVAAYC